MLAHVQVDRRRRAEEAIGGDCIRDALMRTLEVVVIDEMAEARARLRQIREHRGLKPWCSSRPQWWIAWMEACRRLGLVVTNSMKPKYESCFEKLTCF